MKTPVVNKNRRKKIPVPNQIVMRPQGENHLAAGILVNEKEAEKIK